MTEEKRKRHVHSSQNAYPSSTHAACLAAMLEVPQVCRPRRVRVGAFAAHNYGLLQIRPNDVSIATNIPLNFVSFSLSHRLNATKVECCISVL
jgi:hypothetical protein